MSLTLPLRRSALVVAIALTTPLVAVAAAGPSVSALEVAPSGISLWHDLELTGIDSHAHLLTKDVDGDLWYLDGNSPQAIVQVDQLSHAQTEYLISPRAWVLGMVGAPDGSIWFTDDTAKTVDRLDPRSGSITEFPLPGIVGIPSAMALGADGNIWMGDKWGGNLIRVSPTGAIGAVAEPHGAQIIDMVAAPDGRLWYSRTGADTVGTYDPISGLFSDIGVSPDHGVELAVGASGSVWLGGDGDLTEMRPDGSITVHAIPAAGALPPRVLGMAGGAIAGDDDSELLFVLGSDGMGSVASDGTVTLHRLDGFRTSMQVDGEGHIWSNDWASNSLQWR